MQRAPGEKGVFEGDTRRIERKKEKAPRSRWEDGGKESPAWAKEEGEWSTRSRRSLVQRREELAVVREHEEASRLSNPHTSHTDPSAGGGNKTNEKRASTRLCTFLVLAPPGIASSRRMPCCPIPA
ncbi:hypothetical protein B0H13DRAFT_2364165 [Mycena leptocephala]|nr:hypothetical protein B0H13DRAFT_2364165 [Mycena leptocephala]